jgi:hypothetical protein
VSSSTSPVSGPPSISISSLNEKPLASGGKEYTFTGRSMNVPSGDYVFVVDEDPNAPQADLGQYVHGTGPQTWIVSPLTEVDKSGAWSVTWDLSKPPPEEHWIALVYDSSCPGPGPCAGNPYPGLFALGGHAPGVIATAAAKNSS